jgi:hypothetical protein
MNHRYPCYPGVAATGGPFPRIERPKGASSAFRPRLGDRKGVPSNSMPFLIYRRAMPRHDRDMHRPSAIYSSPSGPRSGRTRKANKEGGQGRRTRKADKEGGQGRRTRKADKEGGQGQG